MFLIDGQQPSVWSTVLPIATLVLGWALASLTEIWKGKMNRLIRRNEFQRENLLALQVVASDLLDSVEQTLKPEFRKNVSPDSTRMPPELYDLWLEHQKVTRRSEIIQARLTDRTVSGILTRFSEQSKAAIGCPDIAESIGFHRGATSTFAELNKRIGELLAALDNNK